MSTEPTGADFGATYEAIQGTKYVHIDLKKIDLCGYEGSCPKDMLLYNKNICLFCSHMKKVDVPALVFDKLIEDLGSK